MPSTSWADALETAGSAEGFEVLPKADYHFKVTGSQHKIASTGKDMFELKCTIQEGPHAGRVLFTNLVLSPDNATAMQIFFKKMKALGLTPEYFKGEPSNEEVANAVLDREFRGGVTIRQWQGEDRNEINSIFPVAVVPGGASAPPPPPPAAEMSAPPVPSASAEVPF